LGDEFHCLVVRLPAELRVCPPDYEKAYEKNDCRKGYKKKDRLPVAFQPHLVSISFLDYPGVLPFQCVGVRNKHGLFIDDSLPFQGLFRSFLIFASDVIVHGNADDAVACHFDADLVQGY